MNDFMNSLHSSQDEEGIASGEGRLGMGLTYAISFAIALFVPLCTLFYCWSQGSVTPRLNVIVG